MDALIVTPPKGRLLVANLLVSWHTSFYFTQVASSVNVDDFDEFNNWPGVVCRKPRSHALLCVGLDMATVLGAVQAISLIELVCLSEAVYDMLVAALENDPPPDADLAAAIRLALQPGGKKKR